MKVFFGVRVAVACHLGSLVGEVGGVCAQLSSELGSGYRSLSGEVLGCILRYC